MYVARCYNMWMKVDFLSPLMFVVWPYNKSLSHNIFHNILHKYQGDKLLTINNSHDKYQSDKLLTVNNSHVSKRFI